MTTTPTLQRIRTRLGLTGLNYASAKLALMAVMDKALDPRLPGPSGAEIMLAAEKFKAGKPRPRNLREFLAASFFSRLKIGLFLGEMSVVCGAVAGILYGLYFIQQADTLITASYLVYTLICLQVIAVAAFPEVLVFFSEVMSFNHHLPGDPDVG